MEKWKKYLKNAWVFLNSKVFLYVVLVVALLMMTKFYTDLRNEKIKNDINAQNIIAFSDSLKIERTKSGGLQVSIAGYISTEKDLKKLNKDLYDESKQQKGQILSLNKIVFGLKQDTFLLQSHINYLESIMHQPVKINDSLYSMDWTLNYVWDSVNYDTYKGRTFVGTGIKPGYVWNSGVGNNNDVLKNGLILNHLKTEIIERTSQMELTFGQKVENKQLRVFVKTNYPGFTPKSLEGVLIDPNVKFIRDLIPKKRWFTGFSIGVSSTAGFNLVTGKYGFVVGPSVTWNIYNF